MQCIHYSIVGYRLIRDKEVAAKLVENEVDLMLSEDSDDGVHEYGVKRL